MRATRDDLIDQLIVPPRQVFVGGGWAKTEKLKPVGHAERDHVLAETLQPATELR